MIKLIFFVSLLLGLFLLSIYNLDYLYRYENSLVQTGTILILIFSLIVITRYFILLLFSMLNLTKNVNKNSYNSTHERMVSVIVPCFDEEKVIISSLESLKNQTYTNYEIIVVDDGSRDNTSLIVQNMEYKKGKVKLTTLKKPNSGKANALNFGIAYAKGELILAVDADSKLSTDAIELMVQYFDDPKVGAVAGSVYVTNQDNIWTKLQALEYIQGLNLVRNAQAYLKLVNIIPGPIGMFLKSAILEVGGYRDDTYAEDCDLTLALIGKGYKIDYEIDAISYTEAPESLLDLLKQRYRWTRGILQSILKHKSKLFKLYQNFSMSMVLWYMLFEAIIWPIGSILANIFIIYIAIISGQSQMLIYWWIIFTILDVVATLYCISITKEKFSLILYSIYYRIFFVNIINISKVFATIEEFFDIQMDWGKLDRKGRI